MKEKCFFCWLGAAMICILSCASQKKLTQTDLYFGLLQNNGTKISDSAWTAFVRQDVSKIFTDGFTVTTVEGQWRDRQSKEVYTEPARMVTHVSRMTSFLSVRIDSLRDKYKTMFYQTSVLRVSKKVVAKF